MWNREKLGNRPASRNQRENFELLQMFPRNPAHLLESGHVMLTASLIFVGITILVHGVFTMGNTEALAAITTAVNDAVTALNDLAAKSAAGVDISAPLSALAANLEAAVATDDPPAPTSQAAVAK